MNHHLIHTLAFHGGNGGAGALLVLVLIIGAVLYSNGSKSRRG